jgi:glutamine amidotransferase
MTAPVRVGIVGYRMGNIMSLRNALSVIGVESFVADTPAELDAASHVILPGVGAFPMAMANLRGLGFEPALLRLSRDRRQPLLGICLGMQILASVGEEHEECRGLDLVPGRVTMLQPSGDLRVPHIGWNDTVAVRDNGLVGDTGARKCFYYVHSFHFVPTYAEDTILTCDYGGPFVAGVRRDNVWGVQFHPEKSHAAGLDLLRRFVSVPC